MPPTSNMSRRGNMLRNNTFNDEETIGTLNKSLYNLDKQCSYFCQELNVQFQYIQDLGSFLLFTEARDPYQELAIRLHVWKGLDELLHKTFGLTSDRRPDYVQFLSTQLDVLEMYRRLRPPEPTDHMLTEFMGMVEHRMVELLEEGSQSRQSRSVLTRPSVNHATQKGVSNESATTEVSEQNQEECKQEALAAKKKLTKITRELIERRKLEMDQFIKITLLKKRKYMKKSDNNII